MNGTATVKLPRKPLWRRRWIWGLGLLILMGVCLYGFRAPILTGLAMALDVSEPPAKVDAIYVLGGDHNSRPFFAAAVMRAGLARQVLLPGFGDPGPGGYSEEQMIRGVLVAKGVQPDAIQSLGGPCTSTRDEALALLPFLNQHPNMTVAVITNRMYTRRAQLTFRRVLGPHAARVRFLGVPTDGFRPDNWWRYQQGVRAYLREYVKLLAYPFSG